MDRFNKLMIYFRGYFSGARFFGALQALEHASQYHNGLRKDGVTPEFQHQLEIAEILIPYREHLDDETADRVMVAALCHDLLEDFGHEALGENFRGEEILLLSKNMAPDTASYYQSLSKNAVAAIVKGADRVHNVETMAGVFSPEKIQKYITETREYALPMLKAARKRFPEYAGILTSLANRIKVHLRTIEATTGTGSLMKAVDS